MLESQSSYHYFVEPHSQSIALSQNVAIIGAEPEEEPVWQQIIWNEEPGGNVEHIEEHGLTVDDVEHVLATHESEDISRSSGLSCVFGHTPAGTYIIGCTNCLTKTPSIP